MSSFNNIGKYCHRIEEIEINAEHRFTSEPLPAIEEILDEAKNYSLKKLSLLPSSSLCTNQLCYITVHFPCLENLIIDTFFEAAFSRENWDYMVDKQSYSISLFSSSLKCLSIKTDGVFDLPIINGINAHVTTDAGHSCCVSFYTKKITKDNGDTFDYCFVFLNGHGNNMIPHSITYKRNWATYNIHCKTIKKLGIIFPTVTSNNEKEKKYQTHSVLFVV